MAHQVHQRTECEGGYVVRVPRSTDVLGQALRGTFSVTSLPDDMQAALRKLDGLRAL